MKRPSKAWISQRRAELLSNASDAEKATYKTLRLFGYDVVRQFPIYTGRRIFFADLYIPSLRAVIEIDGGYHYTKKQKRLDVNRSNSLWRMGYHVLRLSNKDARNMEKVKCKLLNCLK